MNYLLVTHIPFARDEQGNAIVDSLWARDLAGLAKAMGLIRVAAPEMRSLDGLRAWSSKTTLLPASGEVRFRGFPAVRSALDFIRWRRIRSILRREVEQADVVHTSNLFPPYTGLSCAHDEAVRLGKKSVFVIAEDFHDMLAWEWIRPARGLQRWRRRRALESLDRRARRSAGTASLTLLHTPASVERYRLSAKHSFAIRQPGHETEQVICPEVLDRRVQSLFSSRPLRIVTACRHAQLKGLDLLIRAVALLESRGIAVHATLYGEGPETNSLQALAKQLGIDANIEFPGALPPGPVLDARLQKGDLFLMPHRTNDFGRAFFDAMAAGLPVLAFHTPASSATVYDGVDGFLAPLDDIQALAERIAALHADRLRLGAAALAARQRALQNTRSEWFRLRAEWTRSLVEEDAHAAA